jgi:hypothetical protein
MEFYYVLLGSRPLWVVFIVTVVLVLLSVYIGYKIGNHVHRKRAGAGGPAAGSIVAASLGLLAFMLAFTFGIASNRYDTRKQLVLKEVNTIGTTYLRANMLPEPPRAEARELLREYVKLRASLISRENWNNPEKIQRIIDESEAIQDRLWTQVEYLGREHPGSEVVSLYIASLNEMIDLHTERVVVALQYHIPGAIWGALYLLTILTFSLVGFEIGMAGGGNIWVSLIIALIFSTVILLIADLDRPMQGNITVSQLPMKQLMEKMELGGP